METDLVINKSCLKILIKLINETVVRGNNSAYTGKLYLEADNSWTNELRFGMNSNNIVLESHASSDESTRMVASTVNGISIIAANGTTARCPLVSEIPPSNITFKSAYTTDTAGTISFTQTANRSTFMLFVTQQGKMGSVYICTRLDGSWTFTKLAGSDITFNTSGTTFSFNATNWANVALIGLFY